MSAPFFVRLRTDSQWEWLPPGADDAATVTGSLDQAAAAAQSRPVVVLVPAERVTLLPATSPTRNRSRMLQALPYVLEERLADDVDALHMAAGPVQADGTLSAAVVARADMDLWLGALRDAGIDPHWLTSDALCVPLQADTWSVLCEHGRCLVREGARRAWVAEPDNLDALVVAALAEAPPAPLRIAVRIAPDAGDPDLRASYDAVEGRQVPVLAGPAPHSTLAVLASGWDRSESIDLLQGPYGRGEDLSQTLRHWRTAAAAAIVLIGAELGFTLHENQRLDAHADVLAQRIEQVYRETFPEAKRVVDARVQMQQQLQNLRAARGGRRDAQGLLALLDQVAPLLPEQPGVRLSALQYRDGNLELDLTAPDFQALDRLRQHLVETGLQARLGSAATADEGVSGRLTITRERKT